MVAVEHGQPFAYGIDDVLSGNCLQMKPLHVVFRSGGAWSYVSWPFGVSGQAYVGIDAIIRRHHARSTRSQTPRLAA